jgi:hypothetical protein
MQPPAPWAQANDNWHRKTAVHVHARRSNGGVAALPARSCLIDGEADSWMTWARTRFVDDLGEDVAERASVPPW